jgi:tetratricopeptide (TPR) repeat protein
MRNKTRLAATILMSVGVVCAQASSQQSAANSFLEKIHAQESVVRQSPGKADGVAWLKLAILYQDAAHFTNSESAYRKAISLLKTKDRSTLAEALDHMGTMYVERSKFAKAEPLERKALEIRESSKDMEGIGASHTHLASLSYGRRDLAAAEAHAEMAASILVPENPDHSREIRATPEEQMAALINLSLVRCAQGASPTAIHDLNRALNLAHAHYAINSVPVGFIDFLLGYAHWKIGDNRTAAALMLSGTTEMESQLGWGHPTYIAALRQYRIFLAQRGEAAEADELGLRIASLERSPQAAFGKFDSILAGSNQLH